MQEGIAGAFWTQDTFSIDVIFIIFLDFMLSIPNQSLTLEIIQSMPRSTSSLVSMLQPSGEVESKRERTVGGYRRIIMERGIKGSSKGPCFSPGDKMEAVGRGPPELYDR